MHKTNMLISQKQLNNIIKEAILKEIGMDTIERAEAKSNVRLYRLVEPMENLIRAIDEVLDDCESTDNLSGCRELSDLKNLILKTRRTILRKDKQHDNFRNHVEDMGDRSFENNF